MLGRSENIASTYLQLVLSHIHSRPKSACLFTAKCAFLVYGYSSVLP